MAQPTKAGQAVTDNAGRIGITTDDPRKRTATIGVQFVGDRYPAVFDLADLAVVTLTAN